MAYDAAGNLIAASYRGKGVRIEDDNLITPNGNRVLTTKVPKQMTEIEASMSATPS